MNITKLPLPGLLLVEPLVYTDSRGSFTETFNEVRWRSHELPTHWVQDNRSRSVRGTLRGLHFQGHKPQGKLVSVAHGEVFDVAVDLRHGSPSFGQWFGTILRAQPVQMLYIPRGFAHGLQCLSEDAQVLYKCDALYDAALDRGIRWNDAAIGINWPLAEPILSDKDAGLPSLSEYLRDHADELPAYEATTAGATT